MKGLSASWGRRVLLRERLRACVVDRDGGPTPVGEALAMGVGAAFGLILWKVRR